MEQIFSKSSETEKRKILRNNATGAEQILWHEIKNGKISGYKFRRQHSINYYVVDFYCPALKIAIEVDGGYHNNKEQIDYDKYRQEIIEDLGIKFIRFTNEEVINGTKQVVKKIKKFINQDPN